MRMVAIRSFQLEESYSERLLLACNTTCTPHPPSSIFHYMSRIDRRGLRECIFSVLHSSMLCR
jgi:hypothetical protein